MSETELLHLVGRGRAMHVDTNSGLIWLTTVIGSSGMINRRREPLCRCGLPRRNARHKDFEVTDDMRAADAARLGERD